MITGKSEELTAMADSNVCGECDGRLTVAWDDKLSLHYLKCGKCGPAKTIKRIPDLTEAYKQGESLPPAIEDRVEKNLAKRQAKQQALAGVVTMGGIPATDLGTGELLLPETIQRLAVYARHYGLDPARGHACLMYGKPYFTLDAYLYHAHEVDNPYRLESRPLNKQEREDYQIPEGAHAWVAQVTVIETGAYLTGLGIVTAEEMAEKSRRDPSKLAAPVVAKHPWLLAQKRGEWQAMRRAFPIGGEEEGNV
ncbi:MAG: hypothetical protein A2Y89_06675 [Chloroflexi bacterium RBG_13_51_18]|nr:MAG: hypothetical protein A2Y89_06675 [Chloroflexi bacterium RBG_13_51_18]